MAVMAAGEIAALVAVIRKTERHQHGAEVRVAKAERAEVMGVLRDSLRGVAGVIDNDFLREDHGVDGVTEGFHIEGAVGTDKLHEVQRRQVAGRIVEEHVFRARIGRVNARGFLRRMPAC